MFIAPRFPMTISGVIRNCVVKTTNDNAILLHTQSVREFHIENTSLIGTGATPVCALEENTSVNGSQQWTERNDFYLQIYGCSVGVQLQNSGGQPSFLYNDWTVGCNPGADQTCFFVNGAVGTPGSRLVVLANTYGTHNHQARVLSATNGAQATFAELILRGESDSPDGTIDCSIFTDTTSIISGAIGTALGANFMPCNSGVSSQVEITGNQNSGYTNLQGYPDNGTEFQPGYYNRGYAQKSNSKASFLNGAGHRGDAQSMTFGLASPDGSIAPNAMFQVYSRKTTDSFPEVNVSGASGNPINNILFADSYNAKVGIGPGFGWDSATSSWKAPVAQLHVRGDGRFEAAGTSNFTSPLQLYAPNNVAAGNVTYMPMGVDANCNDATALEFAFQGAGDATNYGGVGMPCQDFIVKLWPNRHVSIGTPNDTGYSLGVVGTTFSDLYTGPGSAPTGSCSTVGWVFSQDGHVTFCNGSSWVTKI